MENIYDIRNDKKLLFILEDNKSFNKSLCEEQFVAIVVNLYYIDTVHKYMKYINCISNDIDIFIFSSKEEVLKEVKRLKQRELYLISKNNRGRDISALLVSFKEYYPKYKYICFLHDKKYNHEQWENDSKIWEDNLWKNMINSNEYINNILQIFNNNEQIGLLVPPEPIGEYYNAWYADTWYNNFENVKNLGKILNLKCDISKEKRCITLGTVFWAKGISLKRLFDREWTYEDFPNEPMAIDGTLNHAIERIIGYVAQDAGYDTGTVMNKDYAEWLLLYVQDNMQAMQKKMEKNLGINTRHQLIFYDEQEQKIKKFCENNSKIYIYGAGKYGRCILQIMKNLGYLPKGFVVGNGRRCQSRIGDINLYELGDIINESEFGIIISVDYNLQDEVEETLRNNGITNFIMGLI